VFTFGAGMYGQLGHNVNQSESLPRKVFELMGSQVTMLACGRFVLNVFRYNSLLDYSISYIRGNVVQCVYMINGHTFKDFFNSKLNVGC